MDWINIRLTKMVTKTKDTKLKNSLTTLATSFKTSDGKYPLESSLKLALAIFLKRTFKFTKSAKEFPSSTDKCKIGDSWTYIPFTGEANTAQCGEIFKGYMARILQCYGSGLELLRGTDEDQAKITYGLFSKLKIGIEAVEQNRKNLGLKALFTKITQPGCILLNKYLIAHKPI